MKLLKNSNTSGLFVGRCREDNFGAVERTRGRVFEIVVWLLFGTTCLQLAFQKPYVVIIPGQRANLFSAILCAIMLILARAYAGRKGRSANFRESLICLILCFLVLMSALFSADVQTSAVRGFVLVASALGGYFCARFILNTTDGQRFFLWLCVAILAGVVSFGLFNYALWGDIGQKTPWNMNRHAITNLILILSFSPLTLVLTRSGYSRVFGILLLAAGYLVFFLSGERSAVLIPIGLVFLTCLLKGVRLRYAVPMVALMVICMISLYQRIPDYQMRKDFVRTYYRIEAYPFSWHIAKKHPFFGKGLLAPREKFLEDYEIQYPHINKEQFTRAIGWAGSPENLILMLMSELGFPFLFLYVGSVLYLIGRLFIRVKTGGHEDYFPALAVFLSIVAALVHYMVFDGLLYPQLCWFFHLLLGLIPRNPQV